MGALFQINYKYFDSFNEYLSLAKLRNFYPFMTNGKADLEKVQFVKPYSLIFGNESAGLDDKFLAIGTSVKISQGSKIDSLNLSVAVGIGVYKSYTSG
jgi:TrmH family RNA methyltransferase